MQNQTFRAILAALLLSPLMVASQSQTMPANQVSAPQIAFTFDDLPAHGPLPANETRLQVISKIVSALHDAALPPMYGFVNGQWTVSEPGDIAALQAWHDGGNPLGNHTWSLMHVGAFDAEILPRLLEVYRSAGFQFVTLEEAENDDFYRNDTDLRLPVSPDGLEQVMSARGLPLPAHPAPAPQPDTLCR